MVQIFISRVIKEQWCEDKDLGVIKTYKDRQRKVKSFIKQIPRGELMLMGTAQGVAPSSELCGLMKRFIREGQSKRERSV